MIKIVIPGIPKEQKRHRHTKFGNFDPSAKDKKVVQKFYLINRPDEPIEVPVRIGLAAYYPFLKSWSQKFRSTAEGSIKFTKPDIDNISKLYLDAMSGIILADDNLVCDLLAKKRYSANPRVIITITEMDTTNDLFSNR